MTVDKQKLIEINERLNKIRLKFSDINKRAYVLIKNLLFKKDQQEIDKIRNKLNLD